MLSQLAAYATTATFESLPDPVRHQGRRALVNWVGSVFGGAWTATVETAVRSALALGSQGPASLFGRTEHLSLPDASLINCMGGQSQSFDDTDLRTLAHPTGPVASAVFALAQSRPISGQDALTAILVGMELQCRVALAIASGKAHPGWYMTGLTGGIGVAAAIGRLIGLSNESMTSALALAVSQGCGTRATHGSMAAALVPALGARNGLVSAFMAASGFTCSASALDGKNSLLQVLSATGAQNVVLDRLGSHFEVLENTYKPYPTAIVMQPAIDACIRLKRGHAFTTEQITAVELRVHPRGVDLGGNMAPRDFIETQVSTIHWVTIALEHGKATVEHEQPEASDTAALRALKSRIRIVADPDLAPDQARAKLRTSTGEQHTVFVEHAAGSRLNPMTDEQLNEKFEGLCSRHLGPDAVERLKNQCWEFDRNADVSVIPRAASLPPG